MSPTGASFHKHASPSCAFVRAVAWLSARGVKLVVFRQTPVVTPSDLRALGVVLCHQPVTHKRKNETGCRVMRRGSWRMAQIVLHAYAWFSCAEKQLAKTRTIGKGVEECTEREVQRRQHPRYKALHQARDLVSNCQSTNNRCLPA